MGRYWNTYTSFSQPAVEVLRRKAQESVRDAQKKGRDYEPVIPHRGSRQICESWWGQAWCANLERYADYASRLERGRRYFRSGTVVDLKIRPGRVEARVQGSRKTPYKVDIRISPLSEEKCQAIIERCGRKIKTIDKLINGEFPEELQDLFTAEGGLFPSPAEISFICSCPDWALMCKHVAAAMYGIGVRFDENPFFFFHLRGIDIDRFIDVTLENKVESMLQNADVDTDRILHETDLTGLFGVL
jgi:uncharacterized Zn finger protein